MKTYRNLYPQIISFENLYHAFRKARKGKRDRKEVASFELDLEPHLFRLQEELAAHTYTPGPYRNFYIRERKLRLISAAPFRDRVVHHALCRVLDPIWEPRFIYDTYACREELIRARKVTGPARAQALLQADVELETLRLQWRLAHETRCVSTAQYKHGAKLIDEVGKMLGRWRFPAQKP